MNVKKTVKKIAAIGAGALLVGSTLFGASAANLQDFPQPFVTSAGQGDVQFVIGSGSTDDYLGALDIAVALQAAAVSESQVNIPGSAATVEVEGGYKVGTRGTPLTLNGNLQAGRTTLRDTQLPELLGADKTRIGNTDYDYTQRLELSANRKIVHKVINDVPKVVLDLKDGGAVRDLWTYTVTIDSLNVTRLGSSESIELLGKTFTFDPDMSGNNLIMYASDATELLQLNQPVTVTSDGKSYTLEIVGANSDAQDVILRVGNIQKTVKAGTTETFGDLDVFIEDLFITNIPTLSASATVFVGSMKVEVPVDSSPKRIKIDDVSVSGMEGYVNSISGLTTLNFVFTPYSLRNDVPGFDRVEYIEAGQSVKDPLFGTFEISFEGMSYDLMDSAKAQVSAAVSGDYLKLTLDDYYGNSVEIEPFVGDVGDVKYRYFETGKTEGFNVFDDNTQISEDAIFALQETFGTSEVGTRLFQVVRITEDTDATKSKVELRDLSTGSSREYNQNEEILDTDAKIVVNSITEDGFNLSMATSNQIFLKDGKSYVNLSDSAPHVLVVEDGGAASFGLNLSVNGDGDLEIGTPITGVPARVHRARDESMFLSELGTYAVYDRDNKERFDAWVMTDKDDDVEFHVFVAPTGASVVTGGTAGSTVTTQKVNPFSVGIAIRDSSVNLATASKNLIVVGGTCINSVAAELQDVAAGTCGTDSGLHPNEAIVELFDLDSGKVAMLVAGWEAVDTQAAARAVVTGQLSGKSAKLQVTSATNYQIVN